MLQLLQLRTQSWSQDAHTPAWASVGHVSCLQQRKGVHRWAFINSALFGTVCVIQLHISASTGRKARGGWRGEMETGAISSCEWDEGRSGRWGPVRRMEISVPLGALRRFYELLPFSVAAFTELGHTGLTGTLQACGRWSSHKCTWTFCV